MHWTSLVAVALGPLFAAFIFGVVGVAARIAVARYMPNGWLKRQLLAERIKSQYSRANERIAKESEAHPNGWRDFV